MFAQRQSDKTGFSENEIWVRRSFNVFETVSMTIFEHFGVRLLSRIFGKKTPKRTWLCAGISPVCSTDPVKVSKDAASLLVCT